MLRAPFINLVLSLVFAHGIQLPRHSQQGGRWQDDPQGILGVDKPTQWNLDQVPNPNTTDHLVFETVYSLLQHWPSLHMRNGHNIVPGIVPEGTLLYHGARSGKIPRGIEWAAFDFEHAYVYCKEQTNPGSSQRGSWLLTLSTTRPLKVIYFDGKSASKTAGPLDTQDLLAFGESISTPQRMGDETGRSEALCKWGRNFGVDGFVRTEMAFEIILCDFTSGVSVVSFSNIVHELGLPPNISERFAMFEAIKSGGRHNFFPGETRIQLDLAGFVSFYDTQLAPSLVAFRAGQESWKHRVQNVSMDDLSAAVSRLETALTRSPGMSSGIDWRTLIQVIVDRYAGRLELTQHLINSSTTSTDEILDLAIKIQTQLRIMLSPYLHLSAVPTDSSGKGAMNWTVPVYRDCVTTYTKFAASKLNSMTDSEKLLLRAVWGTNREICRVVTKMWVSGVYAGIDSSLNTKDSIDTAEVTHVWKVWTEDLNRLMGWLDWKVWVKCKTTCGPEEICFLHRWPWHFPHNSFSKLGVMAMESFAEKWSPQQPKCVSLVDP